VFIDADKTGDGHYWDELDLRAQRWIGADTWELWRAGMRARLSRWPFEAVILSTRVSLSVVDGRLQKMPTIVGLRCTASDALTKWRPPATVSGRAWAHTAPMPLHRPSLRKFEDVSSRDALSNQGQRTAADRPGCVP
jgi:hypothetical protein